MYHMMGKHWEYHAANYGQINLMNELRKLWVEHVLWTRLFIISAVAEFPDLEVTAKRLLRNPSDFAKIFEIFYGKQKAEIFRSLLDEHLKIASSIVEVVKQGNEKSMEQYSKLWYANADRIAAFLASINPCWSEEEWENLLHDHLQMTTDEVLARLNEEYGKDSILFDIIEEQAFIMADVMTAGMIKQFDI